MAKREQDESPLDEAQAHTPEFLAKAARMAKKGGKRRVSRHGAEGKRVIKRRERKRTYLKH